jgi:hypothetical protein
LWEAADEVQFESARKVWGMFTLHSNDSEKSIAFKEKLHLRLCEFNLNSSRWYDIKDKLTPEVVLKLREQSINSVADEMPPDVIKIIKAIRSGCLEMSEAIKESGVNANRAFSLWNRKDIMDTVEIEKAKRKQLESNE